MTKQAQKTYTAENTFCHPINQAELLKEMPKETEDSIDLRWRLHMPMALITEPKPCLIGKELIAFFPLDEEGVWKLWVYRQGKNRATEEEFFIIYPYTALVLDLGELLKVAGETVSVAKYTENRRGYNPRIRNNEAVLFDWLNK